MSEQEESALTYPAAPDDSGDPLDLLSAPLDDGTAFTAVMTRRPRAKLPSLTLALGTVVVASLGFLGGALVNKHLGSSNSSAGGGAAAFRQLAGAGAGARSSAGTGAGGSGLRSATGSSAGSGTRLFTGAGGGGTIGLIKLIDGNTVYVQTTAGDIVQVKTTSATKVTISQVVPVKDLTPGETVVVLGSKNSSGAIAATSISQANLGG